MSQLNKIVTNFPMSLTDEENRNLALTLSAVVEGGGGGGGSADAIWKPAVNEDGILSWTWDENPNPLIPPASANIKGPRGESGAPGRDGTNGTNGTNGKDGKTPQIQINSSNAHWEWRYSGASEWTDLGVVASGAVGPQGPQGIQGPAGQNGTNGTNGKDGKDAPIPEFQIDSSTAHWQWKYTSASSWTDMGITASGSVGPRGEQGQTGPVGPTGASGAKGDDGFSPTVTTSEIGPTSEHPQGGTSVTITDKNGPNQFNVWNGINGQGATVNLLEGPGIQIRENGTSYTIGVSADYALRSELPDLTPYATSAWVKEQGYLTQPDLSSYATETYVTEASANALSEAESWVEEQGFLKDVPAGYATETYANNASANALSQAKSWVQSEGYLKSVSSSGSIQGNGSTSSPLTLKTSAEQALASVDGKVSKPSPKQQQGAYVVWDRGPAQSWVDFGAAANNWANNFLFDSESPIVNGINGLSASLVQGEFNDVYEVGIDTTDMAANKQYGFTTSGWTEVVVPSVAGYLPTSGGTVSGQLEVHGGSNFDTQFLKLTREGVTGHARLGLGQYGALALKADDSSNHTTQVNIASNTTNDQLVQVQHNGNTVGNLIPAQIHQGSYTPTSADGILHIVLES